MHLQETGWELENQIDLADHNMAPFLELNVFSTDEMYQQDYI